MPNRSDRPKPRRPRPVKKSSARSIAQMLGYIAAIAEAMTQIVRFFGRL
jgi:hypothetical protein